MITLARGNEMTLNPVWARYVGEQMLDWLNWLPNIHLKYLDLSQRFIELNPYYVPESSSSDAELFDRMIVNEEFFEKVSDAESEFGLILALMTFYLPFNFMLPNTPKLLGL